jgi:hypothetical protein
MTAAAACRSSDPPIAGDGRQRLPLWLPIAVLVSRIATQIILAARGRHDYDPRALGVKAVLKIVIHAGKALA